MKKSTLRKTRGNKGKKKGNKGSRSAVLDSQDQYEEDEVRGSQGNAKRVVSKRKKSTKQRTDATKSRNQMTVTGGRATVERSTENKQRRSAEKVASDEEQSNARSMEVLKQEVKLRKITGRDKKKRSKTTSKVVGKSSSQVKRTAKGVKRSARKRSSAQLATPSTVDDQTTKKRRKTRSDKGKVKRDIVQRADAHSRVKGLPNYETVHEKVVSGVSPQNIAQYIQDDCGLCDDLQRSSLVVLLYRYKKSIPFEHRMTRSVTQLATKTEQFSHELSVLTETTRLYELQVTRVGQLIEMEDGAGEPLTALGREMDRGMKYLEQIGTLKKQMGLIGEHGEQKSAADLGETMVSGAMAIIQAKYGDGAQAKLAFIGKKLHEALQQFHVGGDRLPIVGRTALPPSTTKVGETASGVEIHEGVPEPQDDAGSPKPGPNEGIVPDAPDLPSEGDK